MTDPAMAVAELAKKGPDVDVLRQMVQCMAQRLTEVDVKALCGATYDEKQPGRHKTVARKRAPMYGLAPFVNRFLFALEPGCIHVSGLVEGALGAPGQHWVSLRHANHKEASGAGGSEGSGVATV